MREFFKPVLMRTAALVLLAVICLPGICPGEGNTDSEGRLRTVRQPRQSSADGYCEQHADYSNEQIRRVWKDADGKTLSLTVDVRLTGTGDEPTWLSGGGTEHLKVWADWNRNGVFEGGAEDETCGVNGSECIAALSLPVSEHRHYSDGDRLTFDVTAEIPDGIIGDRQVRISLGYGASPDSPCGSLGWGDVRDETIVVGGIEITSPRYREMIYGYHVTVRGTVTGSSGEWNSVGVTVNGVPGRVFGNEFVVNHVPLKKSGLHTLTAVATDMNGNTAETSVRILARSDPNATGSHTEKDFISLIPGDEAGISPFETVLELTGTFRLGDDTALTCTGPEDVVPELAEDGSHRKKYGVRMGTEGIYLFTAEAGDASGDAYTDSVAVAVMNEESLDALLSARWHEMRGFLSVSELDRAARYFVTRVREPFRELFSAFPEDMLELMVHEMADIRFVGMRGKAVEYDLRKTADGKVYSYYLIFVKDEDGLWKIRAF